MKDFNTIIGSRLKKVRNQKRLSLDRVAELTGVSKGMLAQIEKGISNPTVTVLWKIATGLNVSFSYFMEEHEEKLQVVSKTAINFLQEEDGKMRVYPLFPYDENRKFEVFTIELDSGCSHQSDAHAQSVEENIIMIKGKMSLIVGDSAIDLVEGDAIRYRADVPHVYKNEFSNEVEFQQIIYYSI